MSKKPKVNCPECGKECKNERGLKTHQDRYCKGKQEAPTEPENPDVIEEDPLPESITEAPEVLPEPTPIPQPEIEPASEPEPEEDMEIPLWIVPVILIISAVIAVVFLIWKDRKEKNERKKLTENNERSRGIYT